MILYFSKRLLYTKTDIDKQAVFSVVDCMLNPLLYKLYRYNCTLYHPNNTINNDKIVMKMSFIRGEFV